jgi:hypothetical protein
MADSSDIDSALVAKLAADATLSTLMPGGVWIDEGPAGVTQFVIVSLVDEADAAVFGKRAIEDALFLVAAREKKPATGSGNVKAAAARIDVLLNDQVLSVTGYTHMAMHRESRVRLTEVDEVDSSIRWWHRGGRYRVQQSL